MGLSFDDEKSMSDIVGSLHFGQNSDAGVVGLNSTDIQQGDDIEIVDK
jgi:hypothetical protein